jgi:hypothetical protein
MHQRRGAGNASEEGRVMHHNEGAGNASAEGTGNASTKRQVMHQWKERKGAGNACIICDASAEERVVVVVNACDASHVSP